MTSSQRRVLAVLAETDAPLPIERVAVEAKEGRAETFTCLQQFLFAGEARQSAGGRWFCADAGRAALEQA